MMVEKTLAGALSRCNGTTLRPWAFDLPSKPGGTGGSPKRFLVASARGLAVTALAVPVEQRHMYEVVRAGPCWPFFDFEMAGPADELRDADELAVEVVRDRPWPQDVVAQR